MGGRHRARGAGSAKAVPALHLWESPPTSLPNGEDVRGCLVAIAAKRHRRYCRAGMDGAAAALARLYELLDEIERSHPDLPPAGRRNIVRAISSVLTQSKRGEAYRRANR